MNLKDKIRTVPNWPIEGVMFRDITTLLMDPEASKMAYNAFYNRYKDMEIDKIVAIDARGFIFGAVLAYQLDVGLVPIRKKGKLPFTAISAAYTLEYGESIVEMHEDAIEKGNRNCDSKLKRYYKYNASAKWIFQKGSIDSTLFQLTHYNIEAQSIADCEH